MENKVSLTRNKNLQHFSAETDVHINLLEENALSRQKGTVHRLPELRYFLMEQPVLGTNLFFNLDLNYTHFARRGRGFDKTKSFCESERYSGFIPSRCVDFSSDLGASRFGENDIIRAGQRLDLVPQLSYPFYLGQFLNVLPSVGYHQLMYHFDVKESESDFKPYKQIAFKSYLQTNVSFKTQIEKVFEPNKDKNRQYKHVITPEIVFSRRNFIKPQFSRHPFFENLSEQPYSNSGNNVSNEDFYDTSGTYKIQFDYRDRVFHQNMVDFFITNNLIRKTWSSQKEQPNYKKVFSFRLAQSFDFLELQKKTSKEWSAIKSLLIFDFDYFDSHTVVNYYHQLRDSDIFSRMRLKNLNEDFVELSYIRDITVLSGKDIPFVQNKEEILGAGIGLGYSWVRLGGNLEYNAITFERNSWSYDFRLKPPKDCWEIRFRQQKIAGIEDMFWNFSFQMDFGSS